MSLLYIVPMIISLIGTIVWVLIEKRITFGHLFGFICSCVPVLNIASTFIISFSLFYDYYSKTIFDFTKYKYRKYLKQQD